MQQSGNKVEGAVYSENSAVADLLAFDELPPDLREALRSTAFEMNAEDIVQLVRRGMRVTSIVEAVRNQDEFLVRQANAGRWV